MEATGLARKITRILRKVILVKYIGEWGLGFWAWGRDAHPPTSNHEQRGFQKLGQQEEAEDAGVALKSLPSGPPCGFGICFHQLWLHCTRSSRGQRSKAAFICLNCSSVNKISLKKISLGWVAFWDFVLCALAGVLLWLTPDVFPLFI